jgi:phosphoglycolate phosphatase-like HAD superfamily hydrolase
VPLPPSAELVNPHVRRGAFRVAVFDFDGTVSLIREGWSGIMADMGVELLSDPARHAELELEMLRLSGKPSIFQMRKLNELVLASGQPCPPPEELLTEFGRRLFQMTDDRCRRLADGTDAADVWAVPGTHRLLDALRTRDVHLVLASGTPMEYVRHEAELLSLTDYFGERVYAPDGASPNFSKRDVIEQLIRDLGLAGAQIIGFGDGYAETVEMKRAGGVAVGVASLPAGVKGVNPMKRDMLTDLGADLIVPDYADHECLVPWLFGDD